MADFSMTVFRRKDRKYFECQWVDPTTGRKRTRSTGKSTKRDADRFAGKLADELASGRFREKNRLTWDEFCGRYETEVVPSMKPKSQCKVATVFKAVDRVINPKLLTTLDESQISRFQRTLRDEGRSESTIKGYLAYLQAALSWAKRQKLLDAAPVIDMPKRTATMKGRPITGEEFERMLTKAPSVVGEAAADSWRHLLRGLWWGGLRLGEALNLSWTDDRLLSVDLSGRRPMLRIQPDGQKNGTATMTPIAPEFAEFLFATPVDERDGFVFNPLSKFTGRRLARVDAASVVIVDIGTAAGVKVAEKPNRKKTADGKPAAGKVKYASAHDCRRAFGFRWSSRVMPAVLQQLMRHESITTTMQFYVGKNAEAAADALYAAVESKSGRPADTFANSESETAGISAK